MGKIDTYLIIVIFLVGVHPSTGFSQSGGKSDKLPAELVSHQEKQMIPVQEALLKLEQHYDVIFLYDSQLINDKRVQYKELLPPDVLEAANELLKGYEVRVVRLNEHSYAILPESDPQQSALQRFQVEVEGTVTDASTGETLPGVNILVKGTATGASTDQDGNFELTVPSLQDTLVVSFIGYQTKEVPIDGHTELAITLQTQAIAGEELVVIGYGQQRRSDYTGSISSIGSEALEEGGQISSLEEGLQGQAAGVRVVQGSGQPGGHTRIRIRGQNSILGGSDPLYVIDGVPVQGGTNGNTSLLSTLNSGDIESIDILKDASATAIYGARGSNGVVQITTKRGREGQSNVNIGSSVSIGQVIKKIDMLDSGEFVEIANEQARNDGAALPFPNPENAAEINTNWQDEIFQTSLSQNHNVNISGGDEETQYYISGNFSKEEGTIINSDFKRGSFRVNLDQEVAEWFQISSQLFASQSVANRSDTETRAGVLGNALGAPPIHSARNNEGNLVPAETLYQYFFSPSDSDNPVTIALERLDKLTIKRFLGNIRPTFQINNQFSLEMMLAADQVESTQDQYSSRLLYGVPDGTGSERRNETTSYVLESILNYDQTLGDQHQINATGGITWESSESNFLSASASGFVTDDFQNNNLGAGERFEPPSNSITEWDLLSFLGRVNYTFMDRYLFTLTGRADGSSRFGEGNKWGYFPSAAFGWRLHDEEFMSQFDFLSNMTFRLSWGRTGNQAIQPYQSLQRFAPQNLVLGSRNVVGFAPNNLGNPNLKWETTDQYNLGLNLGFAEDRYRFNFNIYHKETSDLLALVNLPQSSGFSSILQNIGSIRNRGIETELGMDIFRDSENLNWSVGLNLSTNRNTVTNLARGEDLFAPALSSVVGSVNIVREGAPLSAFYGLQEDGLTEDGLINFVDQNQDGNITSEDRTILGNSYPDFSFGLNSRVDYRDLYFKVFIYGDIGHELYNANLYYHGLSFFRGANQIASVKNRWTSENPDTNAPYPKATGILNTSPSDRFVEDASFVRLKDIRIGYNLPSENLPVKSARIYLSGQNLITLSEYSWYNPDVNAFSSGDLRVGIDMNTFPVSKTFTVGIDVQF